MVPLSVITDLRRALARLELALSSVDRCMAVTDIDLQLVWCNGPFEALAAKPRLSLLGSGLFGLLQELMDSELLEQFHQALHGCPSHGELECRFERRRDHVFKLRWSQFEQGDDGSGYIFSIDDVTGEHQLRRLEGERDQLVQQVNTCALTGLLNRYGLMAALDDSLEQFKRRRGSLAVFFCDLNKFKLVNDTYGHPIGDALLIEVAKRLRYASRPGDLVARLGGDEFVVVCTSLRDTEQAVRIAERLVQSVTQPLHLAQADGTLVLHPEMSVGISTATTPGATAKELLRDADLAMYHAKKRGDSAPIAYGTAQNCEFQRRSFVRGCLIDTIEAADLDFHLQPICSLSDGTPIGCEVLMQPLECADFLVGATELLQVADSSQLTTDLSRIMLSKLVESIRAFSGCEGDCTFAINVDLPQLMDLAFMDHLNLLLETAGLAPQQFSLEIKQEVLLSSSPRPLLVLQQCRDLGLKVCLDDFCIGSSGLLWLVQAPIDSIKIDRQFVASLLHSESHRHLVAGLVILCERLGLRLMAAGVETEELRVQLLELGCQLGQGYLFHRPQPAEVLLASFTK